MNEANDIPIIHEENIQAISTTVDSILTNDDKKEHATPSYEEIVETSSIIVTTENTNHKKWNRWKNYLLGDVYALDDPYHFSSSKRNFIILLVALGGIAGPMSSMMYMPSILVIAKDLETSMSAVNGSISAFVVFMGLSPLFWAILSDNYGRKRMYLFSGIITVISSILSAISINISMLIVFRALQSFGSTAGLTLGTGVIADTIPIKTRGRAYGIFYTGPLLGPVIGPTVGGFLCQYLGWRSTFYFTAILCGALLIMTIVFLPETLRKQRQQQQTSSIDAYYIDNSKQSSTTRTTLQTPSFWSILRTSFTPMLIMLHDPNTNILILFTGIIFGSFYFLNPTITETFKNRYDYNEWQTGLCYLPLGAGLMIGSIASGHYSDYLLKRLSKEQQKKKVILEKRLLACLPSFLFMPAGYLIYGWSSNSTTTTTNQRHFEVYVPLVGLFLYALGQMWSITPAQVYLVDSKPGYSATAVGVNSCIRCLIGAMTALFSNTVVNKLGNGIMFTILAVLGCLNSMCILICYKYGARWRRKFEEKYYIS
ncbi:major facilitator superfamily domain-containing protein [Cokeromyces recurvatus]|uniref:major facilitator superfamily domain-containing protein n=1 Tax=Cokeromyces recurvatus TaxID=90255 RepID=UPI00221E93CF|nr:major facilitator superfamily domain-containing protein [Cokeromyces recurvatus]KAI7906019.1 major facilitator superfamily domain-containing protein [Cokeromyces recurvatus]